MENMAEALKIAFAVLMFVIALSLSISSFSQAKTAVDTITTIRDRRMEYMEDATNRDIYNAYITPSEDLTRTVGIETVVSTMYNALVGDEVIEIYFFDKSGNAIELYYKTNTDLELVKDSLGPIPVTCIKESEEDRGGVSEELKDVHLDLVLGGKDVIEPIIEEALKEKSEEIRDKCIDAYEAILIYDEGLYKRFKNKEFIESFGEYYPEENKKQKIRVITYTETS